MKWTFGNVKAPFANNCGPTGASGKSGGNRQRDVVLELFFAGKGVRGFSYGREGGDCNGIFWDEKISTQMYFARSPQFAVGNFAPTCLLACLWQG